MGKIAEYLEKVPLHIVLIGVVVYVVAILVTPNRFRLQATLAFMVVWLALNKMTNLGFISTLAKVTAFGAYTGVGFAALLAHGPKRRIPLICLVYSMMAIAASAYVLTAGHRVMALAIRFQFFLLTVNAILLVRAIADEQTLKRVVHGLAIGYFIAAMILLSAVVRNPVETFARGLGRMFPYGSNPNQSGLILCQSAFFAFFLAFRGQRTMLRPILLAIAAISVGLILLTGSRSIVGSLALPLLPLIITVARRPIVAVMGILIVASLVIWIFGFVEHTHLDRLQSLETDRWYIWANYWEEIMERPIFGLLGTRGMSIHAAEGMSHPHNAYIEMLYLGGFSYAVPMLGMAATVCFCALYTWRFRKVLPADPTLITCLCALLLTTYLHGFVNGAIYYPTYAWSFFHIFLSVLFISLGVDMMRYIQSTRSI